MARITFIARMTVKAGREAEFVGLCRRLQTQVRAQEPGTVHYEFFRLREPRGFAVFESFADEAAEERHMHSPWLAEIASAARRSRGLGGQSGNLWSVSGSR